GEPFACHRYLIGPGCPARFGQSAYPWFCAWPAWSMVIGYQWIVGVRPGYCTLLIDPCIPSAWRSLRVYRRWRGAQYEIEIHNPEHVQCGVRELWFDGKHLDGNSIPAPARVGEHHKVIAVMGQDGCRPLWP
ncbi:MAG: glycosyl transferase, partial [Kiritimatiellae bacterium]|nr:glycosyl transferase [Kiritimatiellia bacterium]